jgi:hypothetical protein
MAPSQQIRCFAKSFQSLTTDLSTGCPVDFPLRAATNKKVDNPGSGSCKSTCTKNNHKLESHVNKGLQQVAPTLPTASSTANGDKSKLWKNSYLQRLYVAL